MEKRLPVKYSQTPQLTFRQFTFPKNACFYSSSDTPLISATVIYSAQGVKINYLFRLNLEHYILSDINFKQLIGKTSASPTFFSCGPNL